MDFTILKFISTQLSDPTQFFELNWIILNGEGVGDIGIWKLGADECKKR
jgi:hypothetical protein